MENGSKMYLNRLKSYLRGENEISKLNLSYQISHTYQQIWSIYEYNIIKKNAILHYIKRIQTNFWQKMDHHTGYKWKIHGTNRDGVLFEILEKYALW